MVDMAAAPIALPHVRSAEAPQRDRKLDEGPQEKTASNGTSTGEDGDRVGQPGAVGPAATPLRERLDLVRDFEDAPRRPPTQAPPPRAGSGLRRAGQTLRRTAPTKPYGTRAPCGSPIRCGPDLRTPCEGTRTCP